MFVIFKISEKTIEEIVDIIIEIIEFLIECFKKIGMMNISEKMTEMLWKIPDLDILIFLIIGLLVEKKYIGRVEIFTNVIAITIFFNKKGIKTDLIIMYLGIGFFLAFFLAMPTYLLTIWTRNEYSLPQVYYIFAYLFYGSFAIALIMLYYGGIELSEIIIFEGVILSDIILSLFFFVGLIKFTLYLISIIEKKMS